jgi:putative MATE family efflux protein
MTNPQSKSQPRDLTTGNLHRNIWYLALPMALETGVLNIPQLMDTYWVSKLGSAALAAVTISITIRWVINSLANGLGIGGMAVVARRIGERDREAAEHATGQTIMLSLMVALVLGGAGLLLARPLLLLLGADAEVMPLGLTYLRISFAGLFTLVLLFAINSLLRGAGEATRAMTVLIVYSAATVILEPMLMFGWGPIPALGVAGSALANVLGFSAGVILQMTYLLRGRARITIDLRHLRPDIPLMWRIVRIALPSTIQMVLRSSSRLIILAMVGVYGTYATAGYGVANRMLLIALIPSFWLGNAAGTLVGQNLGANRPKRAETTAWWVSGYAAAYITFLTVILFVWSEPLIALFDPTPEVVAYGSDCLRVIAPSMIATAAGVVLARAFDGSGNTVPAMVINLLTLWGMEAPFAWGLSKLLGAVGIWWGRAIANTANGLLFFVWFRRGRWKEREV